MMTSGRLLAPAAATPEPLKSTMIKILIINVTFLEILPHMYCSLLVLGTSTSPTLPPPPVSLQLTLAASCFPCPVLREAYIHPLFLGHPRLRSALCYLHTANIPQTRISYFASVSAARVKQDFLIDKCLSSCGSRSIQYQGTYSTL